MKNENFITNILTLTSAGFLIFVTGLLIYFFRDYAAKYIRYFMPIPPLAVAAYIYVYNMFENFQGELPSSSLEVAKELSTAILIAALFFAVFTVLLLVFISIMKRFI